MEIIRVICIVLVIELFLFGCKPGETDEVLDEFRVFQRLEHQDSNICSDSIGEIVDVLVCNSTLITTTIYEKTTFTCYDIVSGELIAKSVGRGRGPEEIGQGYLMGRYKDTIVTLFDVNSNKLVYFRENDLRYGGNRALSKYYIDRGVFHTASINDSIILATGMFEDSEYYLLNVKGDNILDKLDYPYFKNQESLENFTKGFLYQGEIAVNNNGDKFAKIGGSVPIVEIGSIQGAKLSRTFAKKYWDSIYRINGKHPAFSRESRFAFHSLNVSNEHLYFMYSGKSMAEKGSEFASGNNLLVLDWEGKPVVRYILDREIRRLSIDFKNNIAFGHSINSETGSPEILLYHLPLISGK